MGRRIVSLRSAIGKCRATLNFRYDTRYRFSFPGFRLFVQRSVDSDTDRKLKFVKPECPKWSGNINMSSKRLTVVLRCGMRAQLGGDFRSSLLDSVNQRLHALE